MRKGLLLYRIVWQAWDMDHATDRQSLKHFARSVFDRQKARAKNEENDVHAAARRSLEQSRQSQTQTPRQSSTPMSIPPRKHSRKLFGF